MKAIALKMDEARAIVTGKQTLLPMFATWHRGPLAICGVERPVSQHETGSFPAVRVGTVKVLDSRLAVSTDARAAGRDLLATQSVWVLDEPREVVERDVCAERCLFDLADAEVVTAVDVKPLNKSAVGGSNGRTRYGMPDVVGAGSRQRAARAPPTTQVGQETTPGLF